MIISTEYKYPSGEKTINAHVVRDSFDLPLRDGKYLKVLNRDTNRFNIFQRYATEVQAKHNLKLIRKEWKNNPDCDYEVSTT